MKIYLDDERMCPIGWTLVKSVPELISLFLYMNINVEHISLDHDLGVTQTGYDFLTWLEEEIFNGNITHIPILSVHSANPVGVQKMMQVISNIDKMRT